MLRIISREEDGKMAKGLYQTCIKDMSNSMSNLIEGRKEAIATYKIASKSI